MYMYVFIDDIMRERKKKKEGGGGLKKILTSVHMMSPTRKQTVEKSAVRSARRFRHIRKESDRAVKTGSMVPNCNKNRFKRQIIIRFRIIRFMHRRNFLKMKLIYACTCICLPVFVVFCFFYLRMLIACIIHYNPIKRKR